MIGKCDVCGGAIAKRNTIGVCSKRPECRTEYRRRWIAQVPVSVNHGGRSCDICDGRVALSNKSGVCSTTPACRLEISRRWKASHPEKHNRTYRRWWRKYHAEHREARNAASRRYRERMSTPCPNVC